jgi:hypothetical protein
VGVCLSDVRYLDPSSKGAVYGPVGVRIGLERQAVWILAAYPERDPPSELGLADVILGGDEVIVAFGDAMPERLGLTAR